MVTKQGLARGKAVVLAMAFGTLLLLSANQAQAALLFWEDNGSFTDKPAGDWADLALPGTSQGAVDSWYGGRFDGTQGGLSFGMEQGLNYGHIDKPTTSSTAGELVDPVPEPASLMLLGGGLLALAAGRARRKNRG